MPETRAMTLPITRSVVAQCAMCRGSGYIIETPPQTDGRQRFSFVECSCVSYHVQATAETLRALLAVTEVGNA